MDVRRIVAAGITAVAAAGLLAGCGSSASPSSTATTDTGGTTTSGTAAGGTTTTTGAWRVYTDATEPSPAPGPDIRSVAVSNDATSVRFRVRFASAPPLQVNPTVGWTDMLLIGIDVPPIGPPPKPDEWRGVDYVLGMHGNQAEIRFRKMKATGPQLTRLPATVTGPVIEFAVPRADLGNPARFNFNVAAGREGGPVESAGDLVPASGTFTYVLSPVAA